MTAVAEPQPHDTTIVATGGRLHGAAAPVAQCPRLLIFGSGVEAAIKQVGKMIMAGRAIPHAIGAALGTAAAAGMGRRQQAHGADAF